MGSSDVRCPVCQEKVWVTAWPLGGLPLGDNLMTSRSEALHVEVIETDLVVCERCGHLFLNSPPLTISERLKNQAIYGLGQEYARAVADTIKWALDRSAGCNSDVVLEYSLSHMTWLSQVPSEAFRTVLIEEDWRYVEKSKDLVSISYASAIGDDLAKRVTSSLGKCRLILLNYVIANVEDPIALLDLTGMMLDSDGLISLTTGYYPAQFRRNMFDFVYRAHHSYFSATNLARVLSHADLFCVAARELDLKGGSIQLLVKRGQHPHCDEFLAMMNAEASRPEDVVDVVSSTKDRVDESVVWLRDLLCKKEQHSIIGYGYGHSVTTLLGYYGIGHMLECIVDDDASRWNLWTPLTAVRVADPERLRGRRRGMTVILAWQHQARIIGRIRELGAQGDVAVPLPVPKLMKV